ncbi:PepSY-associated TM helix domain-containing protein [Actinoplanes awajinensis]|uniref:Peptidase n=1 Tax=Actinoplanes awajinensis subsp. mycoplanecinus TaxID=135947 RepID=A0A101J908_9ACTN|nr:PepSY-associated TM helix domain-containing protein [Actinoplanes awajinensis]KUL22385.1 peptidase [Actinoplanes awajinensis subsp. mycoplanecinus]
MAVTPELSAPEQVETPARAPRQPSALGALLLRLHFYAGVLIAPFLLVAALTGLAYTITPQLDSIVYGDELTVAATGGQTRPLAEQIIAARAVHPGGTLTGVRPGEGDATTQIDFSSPELDEEHLHTVYVDPYTGATTGQLTTWFGSTPLKTWLDDLHRNLHLGVTGRHYSELAASWLWVITLGGVVLWWRRLRGNRTAKRLLAPELGAKKGVRRTRSWHAATGLWLTAGLLILSATGLTWSRYAGGNFHEALDAMRGGTPYVSTTVTGEAAATGGHHGGMVMPGGEAPVDPAAVDTVLAAARKEGLTGPVTIAVPGDAATAWTVSQNRALWPVAADSVAMDSTGRVVDRVDFADWPLTAKLTKWGVAAHMGELFGPVNQILLAALAIGLITVIIWGYRMWWQRRPTRVGRQALVGAPPARGNWVNLPLPVIAVGLPIVFALGWYLPLLGVPLLAFLAFDTAVQVLRPRRRPPVPTSPAPAGS